MLCRGGPCARPQPMWTDWQFICHSGCGRALTIPTRPCKSSPPETSWHKKIRQRPKPITGLEWKEEVVPLGVEPRTHGFSVHCSTTWAKVPCCLQLKSCCFSFASAKVQLFLKLHKHFVVFFQISFFCLFISSFWKKMIPLHTESGCSAVGSALRSGRRGRQFESGHPDKRREATSSGRFPFCFAGAGRDG